jgi:hypothetical protein
LAIAALAICGWAAGTSSARTEHYQVTISVTGPGHVTGGPFDCPGSCSALILQNSDLTLTATPDAAAVFTSWGGSCVQYASDPTCTLVISGPKDVTAGFGTPPPPPPPMFTLTVTKTGTGKGFVGGAGIDCGPTCSVSMTQGSSAALLAVADPGSAFHGWSGGGCSGTGMCTVTLSANVAVTGEFADTAPPQIKTLAGSARRGSIAKLRLRVFDNSGKSRELLSLWNGTTKLASVRVPLQTVVYRHLYTAHWPVPTSLTPGSDKYCAIATDPAGNHSRRSCSLYTIR